MPQRLDEGTILALGAQLWWDGEHHHIAALGVLAETDHPFARGLILHMLATRATPLMDDAAIAAIAQGSEAVRGRAAASRALMLRLAHVIAARGAAGADDPAGPRLGALLDGLGWTGADAVTPGSIDLGDASSLAAAKTVAPCPKPAEDARRIIAFAGAFDPGPELERKLQISLTSPANGNRIALSHGTWGLPHTFHVALTAGTETLPPLAPAMTAEARGAFDARIKRHVETIARSYRMFEHALDGRPALPNVGVVHTIVTTADGMVLEARRSLTAHYHPGAWACSFEEQVRADDWTPETSETFLARSVKRGIEEEFNVAISLDEIDIVKSKLALETGLMNLGILCHVKTAKNAAAFLRDKNRADDELIAIRAVALEHRLADLRELHPGIYALPPAGWHPTAAARLALLLR